MATTLSLDTARRNGKLVLIAGGEIDLGNIDAFDQALTSATDAAGNGETFNVDLSAVEYLDSAAINALFARVDHIHVITAHPLLISIFKMCGLSELVTVQPAPPTADP